MRLSLRTLLAFEDNVFDVEQHRRLEHILPTDPQAEAALDRIRSVVRQPKLGVPGLVDHQEELDPNYVAEYLDHQMPAEVQEQFESYCLSADKYLAEIASIHHILSNVLGEPARTSRECRLKCYAALPPDRMSTASSDISTGVPFSPPKHFRPFEASQEPVPDSPAPDSSAQKRFLTPLWNLLFPQKREQSPSKQNVPAEQSHSLWSFAKIGMCAAALLLGWQQLEKQRTEQALRQATETTAFVTEEQSFGEHNMLDETVAGTQVPDEFLAADNQVEDKQEDQKIATPIHIAESAAIVEPVTSVAASVAASVSTPMVQPIEQTAFTAELPSTSVSTLPSPFTSESSPPVEIAAEDPFAAAAVSPPAGLIADPFQAEDVSEEHAPAENTPPMPPLIQEPPQTSVKETNGENVPAANPEPSETIIAFQPIAAKQHADQLLAKRPTELPIRSLTRPPLPVTAWQSKSASVRPSAPDASIPLSVRSPSIRQTSGVETAPRILGRAVVSDPAYPNVLFSAVTSDSPWQLISSPFDLNGNQYLLTATPFRGSFELASGFRIEMIGDTKLCILPLDASGMPGIFVDYGRIIIRPLKPNQSLRVETEKSSGMVSTAGTESILFIDTFAELSAPPNKTQPAEEQKPKTGPILGCVPKNGEQIVWKSLSQPQPFIVSAQGSLLLQSDQYRFGEIRVLPNWLGTLPMQPEDRMLAERCQRYFTESGGNGEQALTRLVQDDSLAVKTLGLRLWGDLGNFDVPLTVMAEKRKEDEVLRRVLSLYFNEVMLRDAETVQRFADALALVKETQKP